MGTFTAQILIGRDHRYGGGIIPSHAVYLSENSRPAWVLNTVDLFNEGMEKRLVRWIPTVENMLEDAMLLIAIHVIKDEKTIELAKEFCKVGNLDDIEVYEAFSKDDRETLYELVRTTSIEYSIALTIYNESHIKDQYQILDHYECRANIFTLEHINYREGYYG